jgi:chemotaxis protein MotB
MSRSTKKQDTDEPQGAPEWMVTFSDCMTLLLTFFVLLLSFSSFDDKTFRKLEHSLAEALPSIGSSIRRDREAFEIVKPIKYKEELDKGNEKPTLDGQTEANPKILQSELNLYNKKVFLIQSEKIFWGRGTKISFKGRRILSDIAALLRTVPNRIVISENLSFDPAQDGLETGQGPDKAGQNIGFERAWAAIEYLTAKQSLDKKRFSISAASTIPKENPSSNKLYLPKSKDNRILEIVILERSIYH